MNVFPEPKYSELFVLSMFVIAGSFLFFIFRLHWHTGTETTAEIFAVREYAGRDQRISARYSFEVDDKEYLGSKSYGVFFNSLKSVSQEWPIGKKIQVIFIPNNPVINRPASEVNYDLPLYTFSLGIALLRIYFILTKPTKRWRRR